MTRTAEPRTGDTSPAEPPTPGKSLTAAARRALDEAEARRAEQEERVASMPRELGGRRGKEPVRYGDWEHKGLASDF